MPTKARMRGRPAEVAMFSGLNINRRKKRTISPHSCPSLESDKSDYNQPPPSLSHNLGNIDLRTSSLDVNGLLIAVNREMAYESDEESIQNSPIPDFGDSFGPLQFEENKKHSAFVRTKPEEPFGPVTGSNAPMLAAKLPTVNEQPSTINFTQSTQTQPRQPSQPQPQFEPEDYSDEELPFAATKQMASKGQKRNVLPEIHTGIVMTNDKFETYRKSLNSLQMLNRQNSLISNATSDNEDEDDEDEDLLQQERKRKQEIARARQQQEAHLSVHRQKMNKMVGGELVNSATYDEVEQDDDDIMEDVPLSILRAHGFPKALKKQRDPAAGTPTPSGSTGALSTLAGLDSGNTVRHASPDANGRPSLPAVFNQDGFTGGRGLIGEIAREEESKRNRVGRSGNSMMFDSASMPQIDSRQSIHNLVPAQSSYNPQLNDLQVQIKHMSDVVMQMASGGGQAVAGDHMSRMGGVGGGGGGLYSSAASIRSFPAQPYTAAPYSPAFNTPSTNQMRHSAYELSQQSRARPVRIVQEDEEEDDDEAWRKFAEKRQSLKAQWISTE